MTAGSKSAQAFLCKNYGFLPIGIIFFYIIDFSYSLYVKHLTHVVDLQFLGTGINFHKLEKSRLVIALRLGGMWHTEN